MGPVDNQLPLSIKKRNKLTMKKIVAEKRLRYEKIKGISLRRKIHLPNCCLPMGVNPWQVWSGSKELPL